MRQRERDEIVGRAAAASDPRGEREEARTEGIGTRRRAAHDVVRLQGVEDAVDRRPRHGDRLDEIADRRPGGAPGEHVEHLHHAVDHGDPMPARGVCLVSHGGDLPAAPSLTRPRTPVYHPFLNRRSSNLNASRRRRAPSPARTGARRDGKHRHEEHHGDRPCRHPREGHRPHARLLRRQARLPRDVPARSRRQAVDRLPAHHRRPVSRGLSRGGRRPRAGAARRTASTTSASKSTTSIACVAELEGGRAADRRRRWAPTTTARPGSRTRTATASS